MMDLNIEVIREGRPVRVRLWHYAKPEDVTGELLYDSETCAASQGTDGRHAWLHLMYVVDGAVSVQWVHGRNLHIEAPS